MKQNSKMMLSILMVLLVQFVQSKSQGLVDPVTSTAGGVLSSTTSSSDPLVKLDLNLCLIKSVGQFKTFCADDFRELVDLKAYLNVNFPTCFPNGVVIGNLLGLHVHLTLIDAVNVFLGLNGGAGILTASLTNPANCTGGIFAREILVLTINLAIDACNPSWCASSIPLAQLIVKEGPCAGLTLSQVLSLCNSIIAGGPCPSGITIDVLVDLLVKINLNFRAGLVNNLNLCIPKLIALNVNLDC